jgi:hypothetical protein
MIKGEVLKYIVVEKRRKSYIITGETPRECSYHEIQGMTYLTAPYTDTYNEGISDNLKEG